MTVETVNVALEAFDAKAEKLHLQGQWLVERHLMAAVGGPKPAGIPYLWSWSDVAVALDEATVALGPVDTARRHLSFCNPGLASSTTTHTMAAGFQMVKAGEVCWSHRHTMAAVRFVTDGHPEAYTAVDGEKLAMDNYDLLLTPRFSWHDHHNPSDKDVFWLDGLDIGLVRSLNGIFYEPYGEESQPTRPSTSDGIATRSHWLRPAWEQERTARLPLRYAWKDVLAQLALYDDDAGSPYDGLALRYANPITGGPTLPTMDCWVQRLAPGFNGLTHRRTSSGIFYVVSGSGRLETDDTILDFAPGDVMALPNWTNHRFVNESATEPVLLFSMHDSPLLQHVGLFYEEPEFIVGATRAPSIPTRPLTPLYGEGAFADRDER